MSVRLANIGSTVFAGTFIALGALGLAKGDFAAVWQPIFDDMPAPKALAYLCALVALACGLGLLWRPLAAKAARLLFAYLALWFLVCKAPILFLQPTVFGSYENSAETTVIVAAAWVIYAAFGVPWGAQRLAFSAGESGVRIARVIYGLSLVVFGIAHFVYLQETVVLVPAWLPDHVAWAHFTGATYIAAGLAVLSGVCARLAAALVALQIALFTVLVWLPMLAAGRESAFQLGESIVSWTLTAAAWVMADSYRGLPWLARARR